MTPERLEGIRERLSYGDVDHDDVARLLDEVARLTVYPPDSETKTNPKMRAKLFVLVTYIGITSDERAEFTELMLGEGQSWSALTDAQATRLLDALEGYVSIRSLLGMRT